VVSKRIEGFSREKWGRDKGLAESEAIAIKPSFEDNWNQKKESNGSYITRTSATRGEFNCI